MRWISDSYGLTTKGISIKFDCSLIGLTQTSKCPGGR